MRSIIALPAGVRTSTAPDVQVLAHVLAHMEPEIWSPCLPDEKTWEEVLARREAARDICDELLAEFGASLDELVGEAAA